MKKKFKKILKQIMVKTIVMTFVMVFSFFPYGQFLFSGVGISETFLDIQEAQALGIAPGGVDVGLVLWTKADDGVSCTNEGCNPTTWTDRSANGFSFTNVGNPVMESLANNYNPAVNFNSNSHFVANVDPVSSASKEFSLFSVGKRNSTGGDSWQCLFNVSADSHWRNGGFGLCPSTSNNSTMGFWVNNYAYNFVATAAPNNIATPTILSGTYNGNLGSSQMKYFTNHVQRATDNFTGAIGDRGYTYLGSGSHTSYQFNGNMSESIIYDRELTVSERLRVDSYLSLKYGIELEGVAEYVNSEGNAVYTLDGTYNYGIAGIANDPFSTLNQKISGSTKADSIVTIATNNNFVLPNTDASRTQVDANGYMVWAHNNANATAWTTTAAPINRQLLARKWKVQETGTVGTVYFSIPDNSAAGTTLPEELNNEVYLLVDADGDFAAGATEIPLTLNGNKWELPAGVDLTNGQYFTFATFFASPGYTITPQTLDMTEGDAYQNISIVLNTQPTNLVTVRVKIPFFGGQVETDRGSNFGIDFTTANWDTPQIIQVKPIDDTDIEGPHNYQMQFWAYSQDANYDIYDDDKHDLTLVNITDNDVPAPATAPDMTSGTDSGDDTDNITNDNTPDFTVACTGAGHEIKLYIDGAFLGTSHTCVGAGNETITSGNIPDGLHSVTYTETVAPNESAQSPALNITIDTTDPAVPVITSPITGDKTTDTTPTISGTGTPGDKIIIEDGNGMGVCAATVSGGGTWTCEAIMPFTEGDTTLIAKASDVAGNGPVESGPVTVTVDTTAPNAPAAGPDMTAATDSGNDADNNTNNTLPSFDVACTEDGTVTLYVDGLANGTATCAGGVATLTPLTPLTSGAHNITFTESDTLGNESAQSPALNVVIDDTAPVAPAASTSPNPAKDGTAVATTVSGTQAGDSVSIPGMTCTPDPSTGADVTCSGTVGQNGLDGNDTTITVTDGAGNTNTSVQSGLIADNTVPTVDSFTVDLAGANPVLAFAGSDNVAIDHYEVQYDGAGAFTTVTSPVITGFNTSDLHSATIKIIDTAGNEITKTIQWPPEIVITAPITLSNGEINGTTFTITSPTGSDITITSLTGADNFDCGDGGTAGTYTSPVTCTGGTIIATGDLAITANDGIGTGNAVQHYVIDRSTPQISFVAPTKESNQAIDVQIVVTDNNGIDVSEVTLDPNGTTATTSNFVCTQVIVTKVTCSVSVDGETNNGNINIKVTDKAGNENESADKNYYVDTIAPIAPVITTPANGSSTNDNTPTFTGTAEPDSTVTIYADGVPVGAAVVDGNGDYSFDLPQPGFRDGSYDFTATVKDAQGNVSPASALVNIIIDTTNPAPAAITSPTDGSSVTDTTPEFTGTGEEGATVVVKDENGNTVCSATVQADGTWSCTPTTPITGGPHNFTPEITDAAGNGPVAGTSVGITIDTTPTGAPDMNQNSDTGISNDDNLTSDNTPTFTVNCVGAGDTIKLYVDGIDSGATHVCVGVGNEEIVANVITDGEHAVTFTETIGGVESPQSPQLMMEIDTMSPQATIITSPAGGSIMTDNTPTVTGTGEAGSVVDVKDENGVTLCSTTIQPNGTWSCDTSVLNEGATILTPYITDVAGNGPVSGAAVAITIDTIAPDVLDAPHVEGAPIINSVNPAITGSCVDGDVVTVQVDGVNILPTVVCAGGVYTIVPADALTNGAHVLTVTATDGANNVSALSPGTNITIDIATMDSDGDGNPDHDENIAPNGDGNGDGILDSQQNSVATKHNVETGTYTTLEAEGNCNVVNGYDIIAEDSLDVQDKKYDYPVGLNDFTLRCANPGGSVDITFYYDKVYDTSEWQYKKYDNRGKEYSNISSQVEYSIKNVNGLDVTVAEFTLTDGGAADTDGIANGVIVDPSGPALLLKDLNGNSSIGNTVWLDLNSNGKQDDGEPGLEDIRVKLLDSKGRVVARTDTNHNGHYKFENLPKGKYKVIVKKEDVAKYIQTYDPDSKMNGKDTVHLHKNQNYTKGDFGYTNQELRLAKTGDNFMLWVLVGVLMMGSVVGVRLHKKYLG